MNSITEMTYFFLAIMAVAALLAVLALGALTSLLVAGHRAARAGRRTASPATVGRSHGRISPQH